MMDFLSAHPFISLAALALILAFMLDVLDKFTGKAQRR